MEDIRPAKSRAGVPSERLEVSLTLARQVTTQKTSAIALVKDALASRLTVVNHKGSEQPLIFWLHANRLPSGS
jgi:hypothetical protein